MKMIFIQHQQYISTVLIISLIFQSCGGNHGLFLPIKQDQVIPVQTSTRDIISQTNIQTLIGQELTAQGGHVVTFYEEDGKLKANVGINVPQGSSKNYAGLSVTIEQGTDISGLLSSAPQAQQRCIHFKLAQGENPAKVIIYKGTGFKKENKDFSYEIQSIEESQRERLSEQYIQAKEYYKKLLQQRDVLKYPAEIDKLLSLLEILEIQGHKKAGSLLQKLELKVIEAKEGPVANRR
jgi:hypothetical protein